jgi:hypothetical protein
MSPTLVKAVIDLLLMGSIGTVTGRAFLRTRARGSLLELIGAAGWGMLGITHLCEGLRILPFMRWGMEGGPGHYLNLTSLGVGLLLPVGYVLERRHKDA